MVKENEYIYCNAFKFERNKLIHNPKIYTKLENTIL